MLHSRGTSRQIGQSADWRHHLADAADPHDAALVQGWWDQDSQGWYTTVDGLTEQQEQWLRARIDREERDRAAQQTRDLAAADAAREAHQSLRAAQADAADQRRIREYPAGHPEMQIGEVQWWYYTPAEVHVVDGAPGQVPRWLRCLAAEQWPDAGGIQSVRVRIHCERTNRSRAATGVSKVLVDLSPERMGIDATEVGASSWAAR